jgi:hypothetical protein
LPVEINARTRSLVMGPTGASSTATYHSTRSGSALAEWAICAAVRRSSSSSPGELIWVRSSPSSSDNASSIPERSPSPGAGGRTGAGRGPEPVEAMGEGSSPVEGRIAPVCGLDVNCEGRAAGSRTSMMFPQRLQRILRILPRTFSSVMEYLALHWSQMNRIRRRHPDAAQTW